MGLLPEALCVSPLVYVPQGRGGGDVGDRSRSFCAAVKQGDETFISRLAANLRLHTERSVVADALGEDVALVPMPRSAPPKNRNSLWPGRLLAQALVECDMGECVLAVLHRKRAVPKSAYAAPGQRPTAMDHLGSFRVSAATIQPERIVIVDDVVTSGATMLAAVSAVSDMFPAAAVRGFAFFRTQSRGKISKFLSPVESTIRLRSNGRTQRRP